jgi:hypothetical protein
MHRISSRSKSRWTTIAAVGAVLAASTFAAMAAAATESSGAAVSTAAPTAASVTTPALGDPTGSIIVVRRVGSQDSLWNVSPDNASATKLIDLPIRPARMLASPDDSKVAILPGPTTARWLAALPAIGSKIYVYDVARAKLSAFSLASHGVRQIDGMTWLSSTRLLVSGSPIAGQKMHADADDDPIYWLQDRLYTVTTTTGRTAAFRHLRGTEPSAAPGEKLLVYARPCDGGPAPAATGARYIVESLIRLKLTQGSLPHVIRQARYLNSLGIRRFRDPDISPDGRYVVTSTAATDSCDYMVRATGAGAAISTTATTFRGRDRSAWSHAGDSVAFWGTPEVGGVIATTDFYVFSTGSKVLTTDTLPTALTVTGLAWAPDESLLAYSVHSRAHVASDRGELWTLEPGASATPTDLGDGGLPVWLP